jgi:hypothetical protein
MTKRNYDNSDKLQPYKVEEFEAFLKMIGDKNIRHWSLMARALGVDQNTITDWKLHP